MEAVQQAEGVIAGPPDLTAKQSWRAMKSVIMTSLMVASVVAVALPLIAVVWAVLSRGAAVAFHDFPDFFTKEIPNVARRPGGGMGPAILGTLMVTGAATLIAVPLGVLGAVYLHEYGGKNHFSRLVRFMSTVMSGVPSIVMGLFIYIVWTLHFGYSAFGGSVALACLMLPVVIGATEQMLRLVPHHLREASYALGTTKSRDHPDGGVAGGAARHRLGVVAGRGARGGRDGAPAVRRGRRQRVQPASVSGSEHRAVDPDFRQRDVIVRRGAGSRLGRRADADDGDLSCNAVRARVHRAHRKEEVVMQTEDGMEEKKTRPSRGLSTVKPRRDVEPACGVRQPRFVRGLRLSRTSRSTTARSERSAA